MMSFCPSLWTCQTLLRTWRFYIYFLCFYILLYTAAAVQSDSESDGDSAEEADGKQSSFKEYKSLQYIGQTKSDYRMYERMSDQGVCV